MKSQYDQIDAYVTRDGSEIRELMHPAIHGELGSQAQSLAEARVAPGTRTIRHRHHRSEEIYHISSGRGRMLRGERWFDIGPGDTVCIPPGMPHQLESAADHPLVVLCSCSPPYAHDDTELLDGADDPQDHSR